MKNLIYDVGMNNGDDTAYYLDQGFKVIAIDAHPILCNQAGKRFRHYIDKKQLTILNIGIGSESRKMDFWICEKKSVYSSFNKEVASRNNSPHHPIKIQVEPLNSILVEYGIPYYLKIDIEGNDRFCLDGLSSENLPTYISLEDNDTIEYIIKLKSLGYSKFKFISQYNFLPLEKKPIPETVEYERKFLTILSNKFFAKPARRVINSKLFLNINPVSRKYQYCFPEGSSGSFGENTLGN